MNTGPIPTVDRFRCSGSGFHDDGEDDDGLEDDIADSTVARYTSLLESRVGNNIISFLIICGVIFDFRSLVHPGCGRPVYATLSVSYCHVS